MDKGFGIAGVIVAVIGAFIPVVGFWISLFALVFATAGALAGDRVFAIVTICVSLVAFIFMTPRLHIPHDDGIHEGIVLVVIALCLPVLGIVLNAMGKVVIGKGAGSPPGSNGDVS